MQVLFIQGGGKDVHDAWDRKLVDSLTRELGSGVDVRYPRMPNEDDPSLASWRPAIAKELEALDDGAILVGHSVGATLLLYTLLDADVRVTPAALVMIAPPFVGEGGWPAGDIEVRSQLALPAELRVFIYHGSADDTVPASHAQLYAKALPQATVRELAGRDHQLNDDLRDVAEDIRAV